MQIPVYAGQPGGFRIGFRSLQVKRLSRPGRARYPDECCIRDCIDLPT